MNPRVFSQPHISIVMLAYNAAAYLEQSILSIASQNHINYELILMADIGSTDDSVRIAQHLANVHTNVSLSLLPHSTRAHAANIGISLAKGRYIARMDADDVALPQRLSTQIDWMQRYNLDVCGSCVKTFGDQDGVIWFPEKHDDICVELLFRTPLLYATAMMRTDVAKANPFKEDVVYEEYELWTRMANTYRFGNVPQILLKERCHPQQSNRREKTEYADDMKKYRKPYFLNRYPDSSEFDYEAVANIGDKVPQPSLEHVKKAGEWLIRLADSPDKLLRERMLMRWHDTCHRTSQSGIACHETYRELLPRFKSPSRDNFASL